MNTVLKSALFAAVILFGGIYTVDVIYNKVSEGAGNYASIEPASGNNTGSAITETGPEAMMGGTRSPGKENAEDLFEVEEDIRAQSNGIIEDIREENEIMRNEKSTQEMIKETDKMINEAVETEPAAGSDADQKLQDEMVPMTE